MSSLLVDDDEIDSGEHEENSKRSQPVPTPQKPPKKPRSQKHEKSEGRTPTEQSPLPDRSPTMTMDDVISLINRLSSRIELLEKHTSETQIGKIEIPSWVKILLAKIFKSYVKQYRTKNTDRVEEIIPLIDILGIESEYKKSMEEL